MAVMILSREMKLQFGLNLSTRVAPITIATAGGSEAERYVLKMEIL